MDYPKPLNVLDSTRDIMDSSSEKDIEIAEAIDLTCRPADSKDVTQRDNSVEVRTEECACPEEIPDVHNVHVDVCDHDQPKPKDDTILTLESEAGQEHLRELNQELMALNEQGSPKLSLLHGPRLKRKRVTQPKQRNVKRKFSKQGKSVGMQDAMANEPERVVDPDNENDIDKILEEKAMKTNLTAINVKNILKYVVTNEHVLSMVQNSVQEEGDNPSNKPLPEAVFEPKLTRSKAKELIEKQATVPWPLSPYKKETGANSKKITELSFSESESSSDEEYDPDKDENLDDSLNASHTSEVESTKLIIIESSLPSANTLIESIEVSESKAPPEESEDTIALRTRSKLPLNDTPLECIEAQFIAPDITTDLYDSVCDDEEWKVFLSEFLKPLDSSSVDNVDDEANDPEYNFLAEEDIPDREDLRDDRAVKISKKEMQELVAELIEAAEDEQADEEDDNANRKPGCSSALIHERQTQDLNTAFQSAQVETLFDCDTRLQLEEQMRKHIQLLTQMFLFSYEEPGLKLEMEMSKVLLFELYDLSTKNNTCYSRPSAFYAYNLKEAIDIVASRSLNVDDPSVPPQYSKGVRIPNDASLMPLAQSKVFMYPELLPKQYFQPPVPHKLKFSQAEDNLLAMGLEQFLPFSTSKMENSCWSLIKEHMIPVKTVKHICIRAKNLKSNKWPENPVKFFYRMKRAPPVPRAVQQFNPDNVLPPYKRNLNILPVWLQKYITEKARVMCLPSKPALIPIKPVANTPVVSFAGSINAPVKASENLNQECLSGVSLSVTLGSNHASKSSWKQVSPIIKKYSPKRLRKTGGNLTKPLSHVKKIFPKPTIPSPKVPLYGINVQLLASKANKPILLPKPSPENARVPNVQPGQIPEIVTLPKLLPSPDSSNPKQNCTAVVKCAPSLQTDVIGGQIKSAQPKDAQNESVESKNNTKTSNENDEESVQEIPVKFSHAADLHGSESDIEAEMFDDGEDTADDDAVDMQACDNEDDLAALMAASTTIKSIPRQRHNMLKKNKKLMRDRKDLLAMLDYDRIEGDKLKEEREIAYAQAYLLKVKDAVRSSGEIFEEFLRILHEFSQSDANVIQLYRDICNLLKDFPELCEEFVAFLLPEQAQECGKFMEYLNLTKMQVFLKKLEVHFGKHPHHIQKIIKVLTQLQTQRNLTIDDMKSAIIPLLRGQQHLAEEFLQLFSDEAPPESLMTDFEEIFVPGEDEEIVIDEDGFEVIHLPDVIDEYGGQDCMCSCHLSSEKPKLQNRLHHCMGCGIKFIDGRIFVQAGKTLKPCQVVYLSTENEPAEEKATSAVIATKIQTSNLHDVSEVLSKTAKSIMSPASSANSLSPKICSNSDEERETRVLHGKGQSLADAASRPTEAVSGNAILLPSTSNNLNPSVSSDFSLLRHTFCPESRTISLELEAQHPQLEDGDCVAAIMDSDGTNVQIHSLNPSLFLENRSRTEQCLNENHITELAPSLKEKEMAAIDSHNSTIVTDVKISIQEEIKTSLAVPARNRAVTKEGQVVVLWTRESDRILLQMCQQLNPSVETFSIIASKLKKTVEEVSARFQALMALYSQQDNLSFAKPSDQN